MSIKKTVNFIFELNQLKRQIHSGWQMIGVKYPDSVAEHAWRASQIAFILAIMEGADAEKTACIVMVHDNAETRIGDQHKVASRYYSNKDAEHQAFTEQLAPLDSSVADKFQNYFSEYKNRNTKEGIIAKDADWLEVVFEAKELIDLGHKDAIDWINNIEKALETESAKKILEQVKQTEFSEWWKGLKKMTYKKLK